MDKLYLLCELNDEEYTNANYSFYETYMEAKKEAALTCIEQFENFGEMEIESDVFGISSKQNESFYVTNIIEIELDKGTHLLIWHHAYDGVDFRVSFQGTYKECEVKMKEEMDEVINLHPLSDICDNVVDTGEEWQVWDIVEIK